MRHSVLHEVHAVHWVHWKGSCPFERSPSDQKRERSQSVIYVVIVVYYDKYCNIGSQASVELHTGPHKLAGTCGVMLHQGSMGGACAGAQEQIYLHGGRTFHDVERYDMHRTSK